MTRIPLFDRENVASPLLTSLNLDASDEATLELAARTRELVAAIGLDGLSYEVVKRRQDQPSQNQYRYTRPTHDKYFLGGDEPAGIDALGNRVWEHTYHANPDTKVVNDSDLDGIGERRPAYVRENHNHGQGRVSVVRSGKILIAEWRFPKTELLNSEFRDEPSLDYWTDVASSLEFAGMREYTPGDVMAICAREVHGVVAVEPGTTTLAIQGPRARNYSVPYTLVAGGGYAQTACCILKAVELESILVAR